MNQVVILCYYANQCFLNHIHKLLPQDEIISINTSRLRIYTKNVVLYFCSPSLTHHFYGIHNVEVIEDEDLKRVMDPVRYAKFVSEMTWRLTR